MHYAGIDYHKRYSVVIIQNEQGQIVQERRVDPAYPEGFQRLFRECPEPVSVVYESTVNCSWRYEILQPLKRISGSSGFSLAWKPTSCGRGQRRRLCRKTLDVLLQRWSCFRDLEKGVAHESISEIITCDLALPVPSGVGAEISLSGSGRASG